MTTADRLRALVSLLPSDSSAVTLTRQDLVTLLEEAPGASPPSSRDLSVEEVAAETGRAPSTVRGWLISGALRGYKLNARDWRIPRAALRAYLDAQGAGPAEAQPDPENVDISAWRRVRPETRR
ncbi:MAG TPA: helix-turn-helix domain-containing protein [Longimicrobiales bacterium]|nr:helix-turn-helix domain-containing protein [Longimicrobiales bacterium]